MILATTCDLPGYRVLESKGLVVADTVMARHLGRDIIASLRGIVGGEIREYTELLSQARRRVIEKLEEEARRLGANAVICVRFSTSEVAPGMVEILAYGTAVRVEKLHP